MTRKTWVMKAKKGKTLKQKKDKGIEKLIERVVDLQLDLEKLPELPPLEKARFNQELAISHLYYSSKIEGTRLTEKQIERAVHGEEASSAR